MIGPRDLLTGGAETPTIDRTVLRLAVFGVAIVVMFVALFSRLWFLQVLASDDFQLLARENRIRRIETEPQRGRILDRNGKVLVDNRYSLSITLDRNILQKPGKKSTVLKRLSRLLDTPRKDFRRRIKDGTVSPYKPVALANDVPTEAVLKIRENPEDFPGVDTPRLPVRVYPQGKWAAQILGYVGEITGEQLKERYFKKAKPRYKQGDVVGRSGLERSYDKMLRGKPAVTNLIVNSNENVVGERQVREEEFGSDLITSLDIGIQKMAEKALEATILKHRSSGYKATDGGVAVMDPSSGEVYALASYPTYDPAILSDGLQTKEYELLGHRTKNDPNDDALKNRAISVAYEPGSTFKVVTAGAALGLDLVGPYDSFDCPPSKTFGEGTGGVTFRNWSSAHYGFISFPKSLEISCDTFYYQLGWMMESRWGKGLESGDGSERFQKYMRRAGFGDPTGIDLPGEIGGAVPDQEWLNDYCDAIDNPPGCDIWYPGYTVNMSIGQGSLITTPIQMAVTYAALLNGGKVFEPRVAKALGEPDTETDGTGEEVTDEAGDEVIVREFKSKVSARLPLDDTELSRLREGLEDVVMGSSGTARGAFSGFPLDKYAVAGKTGTAQIGETDDNRAWFIGYAPADKPKYLISVYLNFADHGGTSAAPVAREIFEGIFNIDKNTEDVTFGSDASN